MTVRVPCGQRSSVRSCLVSRRSSHAAPRSATRRSAVASTRALSRARALARHFPSVSRDVPPWGVARRGLAASRASSVSRVDLTARRDATTTTTTTTNPTARRATTGGQGGQSPLSYLKHFEWDHAKYPFRRPLPELVSLIQSVRVGGGRRWRSVGGGGGVPSGGGRRRSVLLLLGVRLVGPSSLAVARAVRWRFAPRGPSVVRFHPADAAGRGFRVVKSHRVDDDGAGSVVLGRGWPRATGAVRA